MINFGISAAKQKELEKNLKNSILKESDIVEKFIHSSGHGGQEFKQSGYLRVS
jgi:protein subunit release factor B